jgi:hypothetical protein
MGQRAATPVKQLAFCAVARGVFFASTVSKTSDEAR